VVYILGDVSGDMETPSGTVEALFVAPESGADPESRDAVEVADGGDRG